MRPRRDHVRLHEGVQRGAVGREGRDVVVAEVLGSVVIGECTHGDDVGSVAWHADAQRGGTIVARAGDHHDAGLPGRHRRQVERVGPVGREHRSIHRDVEHTDVVRVLVVNNPLNTLDHVGVGAHTRLVEHAHGHQVGRGCDAPVLTIPSLVGTVARDARDVGAMAIEIPGRPEQASRLVQPPR